MDEPNVIMPIDLEIDEEAKKEKFLYFKRKKKNNLDKSRTISNKGKRKLKRK